MILELGACGLTIVKPPAKGSFLEKAMGSESYMNSEKIGGVTVAQMQLARATIPVDFGKEEYLPNSEYVVYPRDILLRDEDGQVVTEYNGKAYEFVYKHLKGDTVTLEDGSPLRRDAQGYKRYAKGLYATDSKGNVLHDVNRNVIYEIKPGEIVINEYGEPQRDLSNMVPRVVFNGIKDGGLHWCGRQHVGEIQYMDNDVFNDVFQEVAKEANRRMAGGQPLVEAERTTTVASI